MVLRSKKPLVMKKIVLVSALLTLGFHLFSQSLISHYAIGGLGGGKDEKCVFLGTENIQVNFQLFASNLVTSDGQTYYWPEEHEAVYLKLNFLTHEEIVGPVTTFFAPDGFDCSCKSSINSFFIPLDKLGIWEELENVNCKNGVYTLPLTITLLKLNSKGEFDDYLLDDTILKDPNHPFFELNLPYSTDEHDYEKFNEINFEVTLCCNLERTSSSSNCLFNDAFESNDVIGLNSFLETENGLNNFSGILCENDSDWYSFEAVNFEIYLNGNLFHGFILDEDGNSVGNPYKEISKSQKFYLNLSADNFSLGGYQLSIVKSSFPVLGKNTKNIFDNETLTPQEIQQKNNSDLKISIFDLSGKLLISGSENLNSYKQNLGTGIFIVKIIDSNIVKSFKFFNN